jgi:virginiamycin B lyase
MSVGPRSDFDQRRSARVSERDNRITVIVLSLVFVAVLWSSPAAAHDPSAWGGLFRSRDDGGTWFLASPGRFPSAAIALAISPTDTNHLLLATDSGLLRSVNGGRDWILESPAVLVGVVFAVAFSADGRQALVSTGAGVFRGSREHDWRRTPAPAGATPARAIVRGMEAGRAYDTDAPGHAIARIAPDGAIRSFRLPTPIARLGRLAVAPDGAVWFADATTLSVTRLKDGVFARHEARSPGASPFGVAVGADGTVWTTLQGVDKLARISVDGRMTELDVPTRHSELGDITVDRSGAVWFVETRVNQLGRFAAGRFTEFPIPTPSAGLIALAAAPDGAVWFTELRAGKLGRLYDGRVTEFRLPREGARPFGVAVDAENNVWYTDLSGWLGMLPASRARSR